MGGSIGPRPRRGYSKRIGQVSLHQHSAAIVPDSNSQLRRALCTSSTVVDVFLKQTFCRCQWVSSAHRCCVCSRISRFIGYQFLSLAIIYCRSFDILLLVGTLGHSYYCSSQVCPPSSWPSTECWACSTWMLLPFNQSLLLFCLFAMRHTSNIRFLFYLYIVWRRYKKPATK